MAAALAPLLRQRFFDQNGTPLSGGKLWSYVAGTSTPRATYTDESGLTANTNPIILDANGEADVWLKAGYHKFILMDANDVVQWTIDRVSGSASGGGIAAAINIASPGVWYSPAGVGAVQTEEFGNQVFKFSFEANQKIKRIVSVPSDYVGGPITLDLFFYSPSVVNSVRFKLTTTLIRMGVDAIDSTTNQYSEQAEIILTAPANMIQKQVFFLALNGVINLIDLSPSDQLVVELERISTTVGTDDAEDVRVLKDNTEIILA